MFQTMRVVAQEEGVGALWKGIEPGLHRQCVFGGLRIGLYEPVRDWYMKQAGAKPGDTPGVGVKILAGLTTGAFGITVANPTDLVKVRMQAEGKLPPGTPRKYPSAMAAYGIILRQEGLTGLWTGWAPNVARNSIINASEMASYDQIKGVSYPIIMYYYVLYVFVLLCSANASWYNLGSLRGERARTSS